MRPLALLLALAACQGGPSDDTNPDDTEVVDTRVDDTQVVDTEVDETDDTVIPCPDGDVDGVCDDVDLCPGFDDTLDADADGTPDDCDPCPTESPDDSDADGVCDSVDLCPGHNDWIDADGDFQPDGCDPCPADNPDDSDADGVCDSADLCVGFDDMLDADADGVPDDCDPCPLDDPDDSDSDSVCDSDDVCPGGHDGEDRDGDGQPNACDPCPLDNPDDPDGDGVCTMFDACRIGPDDADADADGIADACDACPFDADNDLDQDGVCADRDPCPDGDQTLGADGQLVNCATCVPWNGPLATGTYDQPGDYRVLVDPTLTFEGPLTELIAGTSIDFRGPSLTLTPGSWEIVWRVRGALVADPLVEELLPTPCATATPQTWSLRAQPRTGTWGLSTPLPVTVTGTEPCVVTPWLRGTDGSVVKRGYVFDHVEAVPLCAEASDCPVVAGASSVCTEIGTCAYLGADSDGDRLCDAMDVCAGDDRRNSDLDRVPDACDCDPDESLVYPGAGEACDALDNDCDGLTETETTDGAWYHSLTDYVPAWDGEFVLEEPSVASRYGKVDRTDALLSYLDYRDGPVTYLDAGSYRLDFRYAPTVAGIELTTAVDPASDAGCVEHVEATHLSGATGGDFELTTPLDFEVTRDRCPVNARLWGHLYLKPNWRMDWARIQTRCDTDDDCPALADGASGVCGHEGVCTYLPVCEAG